MSTGDPGILKALVFSHTEDSTLVILLGGVTFPPSLPVKGEPGSLSNSFLPPPREMVRQRSPGTVGIGCCLHHPLLLQGGLGASSWTGANIKMCQDHVWSIEAFYLEKPITVPSSNKATQVCVRVCLGGSSWESHSLATGSWVEHVPLRSGEGRAVCFLCELWILTATIIWDVGLFRLNVWLDWCGNVRRPSRLEPRPPGGPIRKCLLPPSVAEAGSVLYICKCSLHFT